MGPLLTNERSVKLPKSFIAVNLSDKHVSPQPDTHDSP